MSLVVYSKASTTASTAGGAGDALEEIQIEVNYRKKF